MPKKPLSAYLFFSIQNSKALKEKSPEIAHLDVMKKSGEDWKLMTDQQKQKYEKLSLQDKARYQKETDMLEAKGYFINKEGVKSTNIKPELKDFPKDTVVPKQARSAFICFTACKKIGE